MTIINEEFVTVPSGVTIRISDICGIHVDEGKIFVRWLSVDEWFTLPTEDARLLLDHWIRVISARMGIHFSPAENTNEVPTSCP